MSRDKSQATRKDEPAAFWRGWDAMTFWTLVQQSPGVPRDYLKLAEVYAQQDAFGAYAPFFGPSFEVDVEYYRNARLDRWEDAGPSKSFDALALRVWTRLTQPDAGADELLDLELSPAVLHDLAGEGPREATLSATVSFLAENFDRVRDSTDPAVADYILAVAACGEAMLRQAEPAKVVLPFQIPRKNLCGAAVLEVMAEQQARALRLFDRIRVFEERFVRAEPALRGPTLNQLLPCIVGMLEPRPPKEVSTVAGVAFNSMLRFEREYPHLIQRVEREGDRSGERRLGGAVMLATAQRKASGLDFDAYVQPNALAAGGEGVGPVAVFHRISRWLLLTYGRDAEQEGHILAESNEQSENKTKKR